MMNNVLVVGRLIDDVQVTELENGKTVAEIILNVPRSYKNEDGVYEEDKIKCILWGNIALNARDYVKKNDLLGIRGSLSCKDIEKGITVSVSKLSFLSSKSEA